MLNTAYRRCSHFIITHFIIKGGSHFVMAARAWLFVTLSLLASYVSAQDPAEGWMAYAVGTVPAGTERITRLEMTWTVGEKPRNSMAFFSP